MEPKFAHLEGRVTVLEHDQTATTKILDKLEVAIEKLSDICNETNNILNEHEYHLESLDSKIESLQKEEMQIESKPEFLKIYGKYIFSAVLLVGWLLGHFGGSVIGLIIAFLK